MELTNTIVAGSKTFSLVIEGTRLPPDERDSEWPPGKYGPDILQDTGFLLDHRDERTALMAPDTSVTTGRTKPSTTGLESLILRGVAIQLWEVWQNGAFIMALSFRNLKRLALVECNNPMLLTWHQYPQSLESLEMVNPDQTHPYKDGLFLTGKQLAEPIEYFCHLSELNLQNVGAPICEVLPFLSSEAGAQLKILKLHDQEVSGVDQMYTIRRDYTSEQDCPMYKLLVYVCPNLEVLSLDLSSNSVEDQPLDWHVRTMDIGYEGLGLRLEQMNSAPTLPVFDTLRSLRRLYSLRLVIPDHGKARSRHTVDMIARRTCLPELRYFTLAVSACPSTGHIGDVEDIFRLDPDSASYREETPSWRWGRTVPIHTWRHQAQA
ncbi:MAG: hypothetical protein LQ337_003857 [Flavoplaca oasis]|nr:MAG: hypothetical protein LQ337_003857 [Flavoplaca oasis]